MISFLKLPGATYTRVESDGRRTVIRVDAEGVETMEQFPSLSEEFESTFGKSGPLTLPPISHRVNDDGTVTVGPEAMRRLNTGDIPTALACGHGGKPIEDVKVGERVYLKPPDIKCPPSAVEQYETYQDGSRIIYRDGKPVEVWPQLHEVTATVAKQIAVMKAEAFRKMFFGEPAADTPAVVEGQPE